MWRHPPTDSRLVLAWRLALLLAPPLLAVAVGVAVACRPPPSVADDAGVGLRWAWAAALVVGGLLTIWGMCARTLRPQLTGRGLTAGAAGFYAIHLTSLPDGRGLAAAGLVCSLALQTLGELYRQIDLARWQRADRDRSRRHHPAFRGRCGPGDQ